MSTIVPDHPPQVLTRFTMFNLAKNWACLLCFLCFLSPAGAQPESDVSSEKLYQSMRLHESLWRSEPEQKMGNRGPWIPDSKNFDEMFRLRRLLEERAGQGDAAAMFYVAVVSSEAAETYTKGSLGSKQNYESALRLFKQAGAGGIPNGYWNVAVMYANGEGVMQSSLAAVEWYFKAGVGYLAIDDRESAFSALEAIHRIDKNHKLAKRLESQLEKGAPK